MSIKPVLKLMMNNQLLALTGSNALLKPFYQLNYLVAAKECGLFELLLDAPKGFEQLAEVYCTDDKAREALEAWVGLGVQLGYLGLDIYYFPVESRVSLLQHIRQFIKPGGFLLLITCCQGGSLGVGILNLWGAATLTGGRLPSKHELISQLHHAGFQDVQTIRLIPGKELFAFKALPGENA